MNPPIKKWSFSVLRDFEACPYKVYLAKVERAPQPVIEDPAHPLVRGKRVHQEAEDYVRGDGPLTKGLHKFSELLGHLQEQYQEGRVSLEGKWGFTREWRPTGWNDPDCWAMVRLDVAEQVNGRLVRVYDWKTGKSFGKDVAHAQQMQLYAIGAFLYYPDVHLIKTYLGYLDEGKPKTRMYVPTGISELIPRWQARAEKLTNAVAFPAKPNRSNCKYCQFSPNNGGTGRCEYAVEVE